MNIKELKEKKTSWGCVILFFMPFVLVGLWTFFSSIINIYNSEKTQNWPKVIANVKNVKLDYHNDDDGGESYEVKIKYEYLINNKKYQSEKVGFGYGMNGTEDHESLFYKLENSKKVIAYVNPNNNSDSILIKGINNSIIGMLIFSIMWNSLLSIFLIPLFTKDNPRYSPKKIMPFVVIIWIVGFVLLLTKSTHIAIENKVEVIEYKLETEK